MRPRPSFLIPFLMMQQPPSFVPVPGTRVNGPSLFLRQEELLISKGINENIPPKDDSFIRLLTFNVHIFYDSEGRANQDRVYADIKAIEPDVVALQEVPHTLTPEIFKPVDEIFASMGFQNVLRCHAEAYEDLGNVIYSKFKLSETEEKKFKIGNRCYVSGVIEWAGKRLRVSGTHLDVYKESNRMSQMMEMMAFHKSQGYGHVLMADFNAWYTSKELDHSRACGFKDSFDLLKWKRPEYTCWTGTAIDFILLCPTAASDWFFRLSYYNQ